MPTLSISVTISSEVATAVNTWRDTQKDADGNPKYATNAVLAKSILKDALQRILQSSPTASMQTELDKKSTADSVIAGLKDSGIT